MALHVEHSHMCVHSMLRVHQWEFGSYVGSRFQRQSMRSLEAGRAADVTHVDDPRLIAARGYLSTLRHAWITDPRATEARLRAAAVLSFPPSSKPDPAFLDVVVAVCGASLRDPHDMERASVRVARDDVAGLEEAIEAFVDWTVRRERGRLSRLGRGP
jgi:hypothetical protein